MNNIPQECQNTFINLIKKNNRVIEKNLLIKSQSKKKKTETKEKYGKKY